MFPENPLNRIPTAFRTAPTLDVRVQVDLAGLRGAGIDLSDAAEVVEKHTGGKAVSAGLGEVAGKLVFLIVVVVDGNLKEVSIDPGQRRK